MLNHLNISSAWTASYFLPYSSLSVVSPGSRAQQRDITCRWTLVQRMLFHSGSQYNTKKQKKKPQIPLTGFTQTHTRKLPAFCVTTLWEQMETGAAFSEQVNIKQAQSESRPVQTKSWTSEPRGSKLKVWLLVEMGLLEVTSGKCLRLTHFTAYSHLTSDFLTGSEALDYSVYHFSCNTETVWELNQNICKVCSGLNEALWETGIFLIWGFRCPCLDLSENCTGLVRSETTE